MGSRSASVLRATRDTGQLETGRRLSQSLLARGPLCCPLQSKRMGDSLSSGTAFFLAGICSYQIPVTNPCSPLIPNTPRFLVRWAAKQGNNERLEFAGMNRT